MSSEITQVDIDNLADIIWWIKGYAAGAKDQCEECPFNFGHHEALRRARIILSNQIKERKNET